MPTERTRRSNQHEARAVNRADLPKQILRPTTAAPRTRCAPDSAVAGLSRRWRRHRQTESRGDTPGIPAPSTALLRRQMHTALRRGPTPRASRRKRRTYPCSRCDVLNGDETWRRVESYEARRAAASARDRRFRPHHPKAPGAAAAPGPLAVGHSAREGFRPGGAMILSGLTVVGAVRSFEAGAHGSILCVLPSDKVTISVKRRRQTDQQERCGEHGGHSIRSTRSRTEPRVRSRVRARAWRRSVSQP